MKRKIQSKTKPKNNLNKYFKVSQTANNDDPTINEDNDDVQSQTSLFNDAFKNTGDNHYAIKYFNKMIEEIFQNIYDKTLFSLEEHEMIQKYAKLATCSKRLLLSLYSRKISKHRFDKFIKDNEVAESFKELQTNKFIINDVSDLSLEYKLNLLYKSELSCLGKKFGVKYLINRRKEMIETIGKAVNIKHQIVNYFQISNTKSYKSLSDKIDCELNDILKYAFAISNSTRNLFCKITTLFCVTTLDYDEDLQHLGDLNQKSLLFLLKIERNEIVLPLYKLSRKSNIFTNSRHLTEYSTLLDCLFTVRYLIEHKKFSEAWEFYQNRIKDIFSIDKSIITNPQNSVVLNRFSVSSLSINCYSIVVTLFEKMKRYEEAVDILEQLLTATEQLNSSKRRGKWYLRLCINYQHHLKQPKESMKWLAKALNDKSIPDYFKLTFRNRLDKMGPDKMNEVSTIILNDLEENEDDSIGEEESVHLTESDIEINKTRTIEAVRVDNLYDIKSNSRRLNTRYIWNDYENQIICSVEDYVIRHMTNDLEFIRGIHAESSIFIMYFVLLFYDVIYAEVDDVFYTYRQIAPLDLFSSSFRATRKQIIDRRIEWISNAEEKELEEYLEKSWLSHIGEWGLVSNWEMMNDSEDLIDLFRCLGRKLIVGICERFLNNFSSWSSGMPDLVVWNSDSMNYEIIEVKGPGDKLSDKQKMWIMELQRLGANVSLCNVKGINRKKLH